MTLELKVSTEEWPIAGVFAIARGAKEKATVVLAEISEGGFRGRGECVPYARYGETVEAVVATIEAMRPALARGLRREDLAAAMPAGAARNALDCAFWDIEAKRSGRRAWSLAGLRSVEPPETAFTLGLGSIEQMAAAARAASAHPLLKIKLGAPGDPERIAAIRAAAPGARLIVDANEGWTAENFARNMEACAAAGVALVEQPLPAAGDALLADLPRPVPVCADESLHTTADLKRVAALYQAVNIKLDKTGGLTEALSLADMARDRGLMRMAGCMVATSLAMAPAFIIAQKAEFVDLDGPLLLTRDRSPGLEYRASRIQPPPAELWG